MLPGKKYTPEDILRIAWKRRWFILIPLVVIASGTFVWAHYLPNIYEAKATILIVPQRVPEDYVRSTVNARIDDRLNIIAQQIQSRTRLEGLITKFDLYKKERAQGRIMQDIIEMMRGDVILGLVNGKNSQETDAFTITFHSSDAKTTMQVADEIASMFVKENVEDRKVAADQTNMFLQSSLDETRNKLTDKEKQLADFRTRNMGNLPTQIDSNLQLMQSTSLQLQTLIDGITRDRDRLTQLDNAITDALGTLKTPPKVTAMAADGVATPDTPASVQLEFELAKLRGMELRYGSANPELKKQQEIVGVLQKKVDDEKKGLGAPDANGVPLTPEQRQLQQRINAMRADLADTQARLQDKRSQQTRLEEQLNTYRKRLDAAPGNETELAVLMRDYGTLQESYNTMLRKSQESEVALNLERRQIGEQFKVIDGARMPEKPIRPDRVRMNVMGVLGGLALGLGLVALLEYKDTSLKTDGDVTLSLGLPVLAVIPIMITDIDRRLTRRRRMLYAAAGTCVFLFALAAIVVWQRGMLDRWVH